MSDTALTADQTELANDAQFTDMLERVSFQPGILLGSNALTAEQTYHLRRLTRHQRWLVGPGTVFGLQVTIGPPLSGPPDTLLTVKPGYGIDGLGREVLVTEAYAISLTQWLAAQNASPDVAANFVGGTLFLRVTVRAQAVPQALQPVVSELFDAGLDPVVSARVGDSFQLELIGDPSHMQDAPARPLDWWTPLRATPAPGALPGTITAREQTTITGITDPGLAGAMKLQAWLLAQPLPPFDDGPGADTGYVEASRLLLASVHISLAALNPPVTVTPAMASVNNLVRPFVRANALLAAAALP